MDDYPRLCVKNGRETISRLSVICQAVTPWINCMIIIIIIIITIITIEILIIRYHELFFFYYNPMTAFLVHCYVDMTANMFNKIPSTSLSISNTIFEISLKTWLISDLFYKLNDF